jgi:hypothetical protein
LALGEGDGDDPMGGVGMRCGICPPYGCPGSVRDIHALVMAARFSRSVLAASLMSESMVKPPIPAPKPILRIISIGHPFRAASRSNGSTIIGSCACAGSECGRAGALVGAAPLPWGLLGSFWGLGDGMPKAIWKGCGPGGGGGCEDCGVRALFGGAFGLGGGRWG